LHKSTTGEGHQRMKSLGCFLELMAFLLSPSRVGE
jgi:hypothetical protein